MNASEWLTYTQSLTATLALLFLVTFSILLSVRRKLQVRDSEINRILDLLVTRDDISGVAHSADVLALEQRLAQVDQTLSTLSRSQLAFGQTANRGMIDDAVTLAQRGLPAGAIAERCAIATSEAQLLVRLHANAAKGTDEETLQ